MQIEVGNIKIKQEFNMPSADRSMALIIDGKVVASDVGTILEVLSTPIYQTILPYTDESQAKQLTTKSLENITKHLFSRDLRARTLSTEINKDA